MSRKERRSQQRRMVKKLFITWGILGIIGFVWLVYTIISWLAGLIYGAPNQTPISGEYLEHVWTQEETLQDGVGQELASDCLELYEANKELLVLVNQEHALEEGAYEDSLRSICNGRLKASDYLYEDLVDLLAAADEEGHQYWIASAYRSRKRQQELVDEDVMRYMAQGNRLWRKLMSKLCRQERVSMRPGWRWIFCVVKI